MNKTTNAPQTLYPGEHVEIYDIIRKEENRHGSQAIVISKIYTVVKRYQHFVLMQDKRGIRECFTYWYLRRHMRPPKKTRRISGAIGWDWEW